MTLIRTNRSGGCPLCGASGAVCGHPSDSVPIDARMEVAVVGGPLKRYKVTTPHGVETTMKLNEADAERLGGVPLDADVSAPTEAPEGDAPEAKKRAAPANKSRTARTKAAGDGG